MNANEVDIDEQLKAFEAVVDKNDPDQMKLLEEYDSIQNDSSRTRRLEHPSESPFVE